MDLSQPRRIAGVNFGNALMNGAYIGSKTLEDIKNLVSSANGGVIVGSISIEPRAKNPGRGYLLHKENIYSLNSFGMPNGGLPYFQKKLPAVVEVAHAHSKPLIANLAGFSNAEFVALIKLAEDSGADMAELNLSCPNVWKKGLQKSILSYNLPKVKDLLSYIDKQKPKIPISLKISPLPPDLLNEFVQIVSRSKTVKAVVATNSYPNASVSTGTSKKKEEKETLAGLSGRALKPISLGVVAQLHKLLPANIVIIGCGGISSANDVRDYLTAGAQAVQIATGLVNGGLSIFDKLKREFVDVA